MSARLVELFIGQELSDTKRVIRDPATNAVIDLSSGYTGTVKIGPKGGGAALVTKASGVSFAATAPNATIAWATSDLTSLPAGEYRCELIVRQTSSSKDLFDAFILRLRSPLT